LANQNLAASITATASLSTILKRCRVASFTWSADLEAGKELRVDGVDVTVEKDGGNAANSFTGHLFDMLPGDSIVVYTDAEGSRTVRITVVKSDRG
jgi:hypothetical protein